MLKIEEIFAKVDPSNPAMVEMMKNMPVPDDKVVEWGFQMADKLANIPVEVKEKIRQQSEEMFPMFKEAYDEFDVNKLSLITALQCELGRQNVREIGVEIPGNVMMYLVRAMSWGVCLMKELGVTAEEMKELNTLLLVA